MSDLRYHNAHTIFIGLHNEDPVQLFYDGQSIGEETLYAYRMLEMLRAYQPVSSPQLEVAAMAHHLKRWEIKRSDYPLDKQGYFLWRRQVAKHQLSLTAQVLDQSGFDASERDQIIAILKKENLNTNPLAQVMEDVACMVFVQYYLEAFAAPHNTDKVVDIVRKTMLKMSKRAIDETAQLPLNDNVSRLIAQSLDVRS
jgi:hypothetical protein